MLLSHRNVDAAWQPHTKHSAAAAAAAAAYTALACSTALFGSGGGRREQVRSRQRTNLHRCCRCCGCRRGGSDRGGKRIVRVLNADESSFDERLPKPSTLREASDLQGESTVDVHGAAPAKR